MADAFKLVATAGEQTVDVKPGATLIVGRAVSSDVPIYDPTISRQHAQVSILNGGVLVKDLGSSNGTFLNGSRITEATAQPNDVVRFGKVSFYVREMARGATAPAPAAPAPKPAAATIVRQLPIGAEVGLSGKVKRLSMEGGLAAVAGLPPANPPPPTPRRAPPDRRGGRPVGQGQAPPHGGRARGGGRHAARRHARHRRDGQERQEARAAARNFQGAVAPAGRGQAARVHRRHVVPGDGGGLRLHSD